MLWLNGRRQARLSLEQSNVRKKLILLAFVLIAPLSVVSAIVVHGAWFVLVGVPLITIMIMILIFFGITRSTADIRSLSLSGQGLAADDVTFTSPIPEPEVYAMLLSGLSLMGWMARRRNKKTMLERNT